MAKPEAAAMRARYTADMSSTDVLLAPMKGAEHREIGGLQLDLARAGRSRVKRVVYPPGFRWWTLTG